MVIRLALVPDDEKPNDPTQVVPRLNSRLSPGANVLLFTVVRLFHGLVDDPLPSEAAAQLTYYDVPAASAGLPSIKKRQPAKTAKRQGTLELQDIDLSPPRRPPDESYLGSASPLSRRASAVTGHISRAETFQNDRARVK